MCCLKTPSVVISGLLVTLQFMSVDIDIRKYAALKTIFDATQMVCVVLKNVVCNMYIAV